MVHAIGDKGARAAVLAGCTSIEHGTFLSDETLELDEGSEGRISIRTCSCCTTTSTIPPRSASTRQTVAILRKAIAPTADVIRRARARGVKLVFGTDAVAGAHGRNAEEFVYRVKEGGEQPMDVLISATSTQRRIAGPRLAHRRASRPAWTPISSPPTAICSTTSPPSAACGS